MANHTLHYLKRFVVFQNFFFINRSFLLESYRCKIVSWLIFIMSFVWVTGVIIYDFTIAKNNNIQWYVVVAEAVATALILHLAFSAKKAKSFFEIVKELDEKYGFTEEQAKALKKSVTSMIVVTLVSIVIDVMNLVILRMPNRIVVLMTIAFCAQDTELAFYAMIANNCNKRLEKLVEMSPVLGSQVYKHLLAATYSFSYPFRKQIVTMVFIIKLTSIVYAVIAFLASGAMLELLRIYFIWREVKTLYSLWLMCHAAERTRQLCEELLFALAEKMVFQQMDKDMKRITKRWYHCVQTIQPSLTEAVSTVKSNLPLQVMDWTFNYLIIIVQIYMSQKWSFLQAQV